MLNKNQTDLTQEPAFYLPITQGRYEVTPGLFRFPRDFGNGIQDQRIFQFDREYPRYRNEKEQARAERLGKYYCSQDISPDISRTINQFLVQRLTEEHPQLFTVSQHLQGLCLDCLPSGDKVLLDQDYHLLEISPTVLTSPTYCDGFDALANQVQEDLSVFQVDTSGQDRLIALHLCLPNHWAAEDKIGKSFFSTHASVPHMEKINQTAQQLLNAIIHKGPYVRFAWGLATDTRLNHHPHAAPGNSAEAWHGRAFDPDTPALFLRVERQTLHGFPEQQIGLFTIRTYLYDIAWIARNYPGHIQQLISAIKSMSEQSLLYKGLNSSAVAIQDWLNSLIVK